MVKAASGIGVFDSGMRKMLERTGRAAEVFEVTIAYAGIWTDKASYRDIHMYDCLSNVAWPPVSNTKFQTQYQSDPSKISVDVIFKSNEQKHNREETQAHGANHFRHGECSVYYQSPVLPRSLEVVRDLSYTPVTHCTEAQRANRSATVRAPIQYVICFELGSFCYSPGFEDMQHESGKLK